MLVDSDWNIDRHMAERPRRFTFDVEESVRRPLLVYRTADLVGRNLRTH